MMQHLLFAIRKDEPASNFLIRKRMRPLYSVSECNLWFISRAAGAIRHGYNLPNIESFSHSRHHLLIIYIYL